MNVLITGGSGFIGKNLVEGLSERHRIFAPSHHELDVLDYQGLVSYVENNRIDVIVHGAIHVPMFNGSSHELSNDIMMFLNMEKISSLVERILYFGSGAEFDKRLHIRNVTEDEFGRSIPNTKYGIAKYTMNLMARKSDNIYNLRLFGIFGKYELWELKFISNLCCKAVYDLPLTIRRDCMFNFLYIDDLIRVVDRFICIPPEYHDINVCHDASYKLSELANMVKRTCGKNLEIQMISNELNLDYTASNKRLHEEIGDLQITPMPQAIESLYKYYFDNKSLIDYEKLKATR